MTSASILGLDVHLQVRGAGQPIVMIHGMTADHHSLMGAFEPIFVKRSGWQRIYFDLPGMGLTPGAEWISGSDQMLEVVAGVMEALVPHGPVVVIGQSYGGYLARGLAVRHPERVAGLFLLSPTVKAGDPTRRVPEKRIIYSEAETVTSLTPELQAALNEAATVHTRAVVERLLADYVPARAKCDFEFLRRVRERYAFSFDLNQTTLECPTLLVAGRQDAIVGYADQLELYAQFPRGTIAVLDRAGHVAELEASALFIALTNNWLDRVEESLAMPVGEGS